MTNQTVKENLLVLLEEYTSRSDSKASSIARKSVVLALKAIDAYGKPLDDDDFKE